MSPRQSPLKDDDPIPLAVQLSAARLFRAAKPFANAPPPETWAEKLLKLIIGQEAFARYWTRRVDSFYRNIFRELMQQEEREHGGPIDWTRMEREAAAEADEPCSATMRERARQEMWERRILEAARAEADGCAVEERPVRWIRTRIADDLMPYQAW